MINEIKEYEDIFLPTINSGIENYDRIIETYDAISLADLIGVFNPDDFLIFMQQQRDRLYIEYAKLIYNQKN